MVGWSRAESVEKAEMPSKAAGLSREREFKKKKGQRWPKGTKDISMLHE